MAADCAAIEGRNENIVQAVELRVRYVVSIAEVSVYELDLGEMGYPTAWKPVTVSFAIHNMSDTELVFRIRHIPYVLLIRLCFHHGPPRIVPFTVPRIASCLLPSLCRLARAKKRL